MNKFWHICNGKALAKIQSEGLVARLGARSIRFGNSAEAIYVCDSLDSATNLSKIPLWATNPENKQFGQMLIEVQTCETGKPDPYFRGGIILKQHIPADRIRFLKTLTEPQAPINNEDAIFIRKIQNWLLQPKQYIKAYQKRIVKMQAQIQSVPQTLINK